MEKKLFLIRHCKAEGQEPTAALTPEGKQDAEKLVPILESLQVEHIISSPFKRAIQTIEPFAQKSGIPIHLKEDLKERTLSGEPMDDWFTQLARTFEDKDLAFPGGESSNTALARIKDIVEAIIANPKMDKVALVSHGNLLSLLINHYDATFGFDQWSQMKNPEVYVLTVNNNISIEAFS